MEYYGAIQSTSTIHSRGDFGGTEMAHVCHMIESGATATVVPRPSVLTIREISQTTLRGRENIQNRLVGGMPGTWNNVRGFNEGSYQVGRENKCLGQKSAMRVLIFKILTSDSEMRNDCTRSEVPDIE